MGTERCENKAVAILNKMQQGKTTLIKKDGGEMLIAIVLDKPLLEAQALVIGNLRNKFLIWLKHRVGRLPIKNGPPSCHQLK